MVGKFLRKLEDDCTGANGFLDILLVESNMVYSILRFFVRTTDQTSHLDFFGALFKQFIS